jgi:hypothetical protein
VVDRFEMELNFLIPSVNVIIVDAEIQTHANYLSYSQTETDLPRPIPYTKLSYSADWQNTLFNILLNSTPD